jgi:GDP-4-dehydro-6-deoxy-D-mannose reductase
MPTTTAIGNIAHQINAHETADTLQLVAGRLDVLRDFVPLSFVGEAITAIALAPVVEDIYNICSGHGFVLRDLVDAMASLRNLRLETSIDPDLAAIPAVDGIVGNPTRIANLTGGGWEPSISELAAIALNRDAL